VDGEASGRAVPVESRDGHSISVRYGTALLWLGTVAFIGIGGLFLLATPVVGACIAAAGVVCLVELRKAKRIGDRALVLDDGGLSHTTLTLGAVYRIPWREVIAVREGQRGVGLTLRGPRGRFRVPPRERAGERDQGSLFLTDLLDISVGELAELIRSHVPDAGEAPPR
jgi:hypothetical protein